MAENENTSNTLEPNNSQVIFNDPFDYSENKSSDPFEGVNFDLNDDGELEVTGLDDKLESDKEKKESDKSLETSSENLEDIKPLLVPKVNPFESNLKKEELLKENKELKDRISKLESRFEEQDKSATLEEKKSKLEAAGFTDEQINSILEILPSEEIKLKKEEKTEVDKEFDQREIAEVFSIYNGENGAPSIQELKPHVDYVYNLYPELASKYPLKTGFRVAENGLFINWLYHQEPEKMKALSLEEQFQVSENLRKIYYQKVGKPSNSLDHLRLLKAKNPSENVVDGVPKPNNNQIKQFSKREGLNVPGGEIETEEEIREKTRARSAREVVEMTVNAALSGN